MNDAASHALADDDETSVTLPSSCTLRDSLALKALLLDQLALGVNLLVDGSAVERIDTAGLQLLAASARDIGERKQRMRWSGASAQLRAAASRIGVSGLLGLPSDEAGPR